MFASRRRSKLFFPLVLSFLASLLTPSVCPSAPGPQQPPEPLSVPELKARAESGDSAARFQLAQFLLTASPAAPGFGLAVNWLRSVDGSNHYYEFILGYLYEQGRGVPQDYSTAARYYEAAALQGYAPAENNLGSLYRHGLGVPKDFSKAFELYLASARQADPIAQFNLALMYHNGCGVARDDSEAARWFQAAADQGQPAAQYYLGFFYFKGMGVPLDYQAAAHWITLAAEKGHPSAMRDLGYLYESGKGLPLNYVSAYVWYSRAVAGGDAPSLDRLKNLSQIMTRHQIDQADSLAFGPAIPTQRGPALSALSLRAFFPSP